MLLAYRTFKNPAIITQVAKPTLIPRVSNTVKGLLVIGLSRPPYHMQTTPWYYLFTLDELNFLACSVNDAYSRWTGS